MPDAIITVENLGKRYRLGAGRPSERYTALRDVISDTARSLFRRNSGLAVFNKSGAPNSEFWALKDVSFEVKKGEVVGIIGRNGAGKSTLLKILSRITEPTEGRVRIRGRVASLLEVGTGFHPELTGRENIFLNGAVLGMARSEIKIKFDEIVSFAEVERFLDTPVKRYSSGMYVRLAFAVAAHLEPEILVIDEVLAVGDAEFQTKCLGKMREVSRGGRTVLFVSHNTAAVRALCRSGLLLDRGSVVLAGDVTACLDRYSTGFAAGDGQSWQRPPQLPEDVALRFDSIAATLSGEQPSHTLEIDLALTSSQPHKAAFLAVDILDDSGTAIMQAIPRLNGFINSEQHKHSARLRMELPPLIPGRYSATVWVGTHYTETLDQIASAVCFDVRDSPSAGRTFPHFPDHGRIVPFSSIQSQPVTSGDVARPAKH